MVCVTARAGIALRGLNWRFLDLFNGTTFLPSPCLPAGRSAHSAALREKAFFWLILAHSGKSLTIRVMPSLIVSNPSGDLIWFHRTIFKKFSRRDFGELSQAVAERAEPE
jgi:hypothetical protein